MSAILGKCDAGDRRTVAVVILARSCGRHSAVEWLCSPISEVVEWGNGSARISSGVNSSRYSVQSPSTSSDLQFLRGQLPGEFVKAMECG